MMSRSLYPPLTTVAQPISEMARTAVSLMLKQINSTENATSEHIILPHKFIKRQSVRNLLTDS